MSPLQLIGRAYAPGRSAARARARARETCRWACHTLGVGERCQAVTRDGLPCRSATLKGESFCRHHHRLVAEVGAEALRSGDYVRHRRRDSRRVQAVAKPSKRNGSKTPRTAARNGNGSVSPAEVRPRLAALVGENLSALEETLLQVALGADRPTWVTTTCRHCNRDGRHEVLIPDNRVRLDAAVKLLEQGLGKARE